MERKFYKIKKDRKYASFVDEYRRYYVNGKTIKIKMAKGKKIGNEMFKFCVEQVTRPIWKAKISKKVEYEDYFEGMKLGDSKYRKNIIISEFKPNKKFSLEYEDERKNLYKVTLETKSNESYKIKYSEWVKKDKPFFGMNDTLGKIFMRRSIKRKINLFKIKILKKFFGIDIKIKNEKREFEKSKKIQNRGFIQRRELGYNDDFAGKFDKNIKAPDLPSNLDDGEE